MPKDILTDTRDQIARALADPAIALLTTKSYPDGVNCIPAAAGDSWFLVQIIDDNVLYDGFRAVRVQDVTKVEPSPRAAFLAEALRQRGLSPQPVPPIDLAAAAPMVRGASEASLLVTVSCEETDPDHCSVGLIQSVDDANVTLLEVTPDAAWEPQPTTIPLANITLVEFGGLYADALALVSGPPPGFGPEEPAPRKRRGRKPKSAPPADPASPPADSDAPNPAAQPGAAASPAGKALNPPAQAAPTPDAARPADEAARRPNGNGQSAPPPHPR